MEIKIKKIILLAFTLYPFFTYSQINSNSIERFFLKRPCGLYYWNTVNSSARFGEDSLFETFLPVQIVYFQSDSVIHKEYKNLKSESRLNNYEIRYPESDTTYFYYIPENNIQNSGLNFYRADQSEISYKFNNAPLCNSKEEFSSVLSSISLFESDLKKYAGLKFENSELIYDVPFMFVSSALYAYLSYEGFRNKNAGGIKGALYVTGGALSAGLSIFALIRSIAGFYNYLWNNSEINDIAERINNNNY